MTDDMPVTDHHDGRPDQSPARPPDRLRVPSPGPRPNVASAMAKGAGVGSVAIFFLLEAVRFIPYLVLLAFVVACALVALVPRGRQVLKAGLAGLALAGALIAFTPVMDWSVDTLDVTVPARSADVIVILGAGMYCGTGDLDAASLARITRGLTLWKAGYAPEITVSDADPSIVGDRCPSQGAVTTGFISSLYGDAGPKVTVLQRMRTTRTEAREVARLRVSRGWRRVMVVTSPTHSRRALDTFRRAGVDAVVVAATEPQFDRTFSHPSDRLRALGPVVREIAGMVKYRLTS